MVANRSKYPGLPNPIRCFARLYLTCAGWALRRAINDLKRRHSQSSIAKSPLIVADGLDGSAIEAALRRLETSDFFSFSLVRRYVKTIAVFPYPLRRGFLVGAVFLTEGFRANISEERLAAFFVRYAVQARMLLDFHIYSMICYEKRCRRLSYLVELRCMEKIGCSSEEIEEQESFIQRVS